MTTAFLLTPLSFSLRSLASFVFFFRRSRRARAALVFSRMNAERKEVVFVREIIDKREKFFLFSHFDEKKKGRVAFFGPSLVRISYSATQKENLFPLYLREVSLRFATASFLFSS